MTIFLTRLLLVTCFLAGPFWEEGGKGVGQWWTKDTVVVMSCTLAHHAHISRERGQGHSSDVGQLSNGSEGRKEKCLRGAPGDDGGLQDFRNKQKKKAESWEG